MRLLRQVDGPLVNRVQRQIELPALGLAQPFEQIDLACAPEIAAARARLRVERDQARVECSQEDALRTARAGGSAGVRPDRDPPAVEVALPLELETRDITNDERPAAARAAGAFISSLL